MSLNSWLMFLRVVAKLYAEFRLTGLPLVETYPEDIGGKPILFTVGISYVDAAHSPVGISADHISEAVAAGFAENANEAATKPKGGRDKAT
jgi:hypothetical protein